MNKKDVLPKIKLFIFWLVLTVSFIATAVIVHFQANGWQINYQTWELVKTGMISLDGEPNNVEVKINSKVYANSLPIKIRNLQPGYYDVQISAPDYQPWQVTARVEPGMASIYPYIMLVFENAQDSLVPNNITKEKVKNEQQKQSRNIKIQGSEVYWQDKLVTRFSSDILGVVATTDNNHLIFQQANEIRTVDINGANNQLLFKLANSQPTAFYISNNNRTIYYLDQDAVFAKLIR